MTPIPATVSVPLKLTRWAEAPIPAVWGGGIERERGDVYYIEEMIQKYGQKSQSSTHLFSLFVDDVSCLWIHRFHFHHLV
jgi:hypothetical protein